MNTLVILAAGMGRRFDGGIKQLTKVMDNKTIMELSIDNAKRAGFNKVIFIIRKELKELFDEQIIPNIDIIYEYKYQTVDELRGKPWGTGEAILTLKGIDKQFCLINSDDYYTYDAFNKISKCDDNAIVLYKIKNTVFHDTLLNRGVCIVENNYLTNIKEVIGIEKKDNLFIADDHIDPNTLVSMNMWGFNSNILNLFEEEFIKFKNNIKDYKNDEFLIPSVINYLIKSGKIKVKTYITDDKCFGITYSDDVKLFNDIIKDDNN